MKRVSVYLGSSLGARASYLAAATELCESLVRRNIGLVYGGASVGLMGAIAELAMRLGGEVTGIIPQALVDRELASKSITRLHITNGLASRIEQMLEWSDGFVVLPGGLGTLEELVQVMVHAVLGEHRKPIGLLNTDGYYDLLLDFLDHTVNEGFVRREDRENLIVETSPDQLLDRMLTYEPSANLDKWFAGRGDAASQSEYTEHAPRS